MPEIIEKLKLEEKWSFLAAPDFKVENVGKNTVRIKGRAAFKDVISKNGRKYVDEELMKAARTWIGKPFTINHDPKKIAGDVKWMEYEDAEMEYVVDINRQPWVDLYRSKSTEIKGVSIEAGYLSNECPFPHCKKLLYSDAEWYDHMTKEHYVKYATHIPRGIIGTALSGVLSPEEPGVPGTSWELMETATFKPIAQLLEIVIKRDEKIEERKMEDKLSGKASITTIPRVAWDQKTPSTPGIVEANTPTQTTQKEPLITKPQVTEAKPSVTEDLKIAEPCSPELKACVDELTPKYGEERAWAICRSRVGETVIPSTTITLKETTTVDKLVFNAKEMYVPKGTSPEEYNRIFSETKQQNDSDKMVVDTVNEIIDVVSKPMSVTFPEIRIPKDDTSWKETIVNLSKDDISWKETIANLPKDDTTWKEELLKKADAEPLIKELTDAKTALAKTTENLAKLEETVATDRKNNETMLNAAKAVATENKRIQEEMTLEHARKMADKDKELAEVKQKQAETEKKLQETAVRTDNLEDKQKGMFKGQSKQLEPEKTTHTKPEDDMRKTVQRRN